MSESAATPNKATPATQGPSDGLSKPALARAAAKQEPPKTPRPTASALRRALLEVVERGRLADAAGFARELHIDLSEKRRGGALARGRGRMIERAALGVFGGFCLAAAATLALKTDPRETGAASLVAASGSDLVAVGDIATGAIPFPAESDGSLRLSNADMERVLKVLPVRCAPAVAVAETTVLGLPLGESRDPADALPNGCVEETRYDVSRGVFTQRAALSGGAFYEINGAVRLENGALCHLTAGATVHIVGRGVAPEHARAATDIVQSRITELAGRPVCHSFRLTRPGELVFVADVVVPGSPTGESGATEPFTMRAQ